jgi:hypothetical protein
MMKNIFIVLLITSGLSAHAFVYSTSESKYHTAPPVEFTNQQGEFRSATQLGRISSAILSPVGIVVGGLLGGLASGLDQGGYEGVNKKFE